jgi:hypothetical protein
MKVTSMALNWELVVLDLDSVLPYQGCLDLVDSDGTILDVALRNGMCPREVETRNRAAE